ncbi:hypothetical protein MMC14_000053 [Varicellaria rhodocarpa]|nr:hypothetical protein [Varicellaria rhodocarpa]
MSTTALDDHNSIPVNAFLRAIRSAASRAQTATNRFRSNTTDLGSLSMDRQAQSEAVPGELSIVQLGSLGNETLAQAVSKDPQTLQNSKILHNHRLLQTHRPITSFIGKLTNGYHGEGNSNRQIERNGDLGSSSYRSVVSSPTEPGSSTDTSSLTALKIPTHESDESDHVVDPSLAAECSKHIEDSRRSLRSTPVASVQYPVDSDIPTNSQDTSGRHQGNHISSTAQPILGKRKRGRPRLPQRESQSSRAQHPFREIIFHLDTFKEEGTGPIRTAVQQKRRENVNQLASLESKSADIANPQSQKNTVQSPLSGPRSVQETTIPVVQMSPHDISLLGPGQTMLSNQGAQIGNFSGESKNQRSTPLTSEIALQHDPTISTTSFPRTNTARDLLNGDRKDSHTSSSSIRTGGRITEQIPSNNRVSLPTDMKYSTASRNSNFGRYSVNKSEIAQESHSTLESVLTDPTLIKFPILQNGSSHTSLVRPGSELKNEKEVHRSHHYISPYSLKRQNEIHTGDCYTSPYHPKGQDEYSANEVYDSLNSALPTHKTESEPLTMSTQPRSHIHFTEEGYMIIERPSSPPQEILTHYVPSNRTAPISSLLRSRESGGAHQYDGVFLNSHGVISILRKHLDERLTYWREWTGASKDVLVVTWAPNGLNFAIGASTDLDDLNIQYNRRNNLLLGSLDNNTLRELPNHYVDRPLPETFESGDNSLQATFDTVDPELYTTVSSVRFNNHGDRMFTASYDFTVKVWDVAHGKSTCVSTLQHEGVVDHIALSGNFLATGQKTIKESIRIYQLDKFDDIDSINADEGPIATFQSTRAQRLTMFPTCLQFGKSPPTTGLLLGGFSEVNIDTRASDREGDICLWDIETRHSYRITPAAQSVWDLAWHPKLSIFAAATAPGGRTTLTNRYTTHSVVRTWSPMESLGRIMEFECPAADINLVTFNPRDDHYLSASCTDASTYVWDCRMPDEVLHQLKHGLPIDEFDPELPIEDQDTGVCMSTWDQDSRVLYTGSSDGIIKAWDIYRSAEDASIREVAKFDSGIMCGSFSPDYTNLLVGLSKGGVQILSSSPITHPSDDETDSDLKAAYETILHIPAKEPKKEDSGIATARELLNSGRLVVHPVYGAGQGPHYEGPYAAHAHPADADPSVTDLLPEIRAMQLDESERRAGRRAGGKPQNPALKQVYRNAGKIAYARNYSRYGIKREKQGTKRGLEEDGETRVRHGGAKRGRGTAKDPIALDDDDDEEMAEPDQAVMAIAKDKGKGVKREEAEEDDGFEEDPCEEDYWFY